MTCYYKHDPDDSPYNQMSDLKVLFNPFRKRADNMSALFRYTVRRVGWMLLSSTGVGCEGICKIGQKDSIKAKPGRRSGIKCGKETKVSANGAYGRES